MSPAKSVAPIEEEDGGETRPRPLFLGLAGGSGSGKSALASALVHALAPASVVTLSFDAYYHDRLEAGPSGRENFDHPDALEATLLGEHLEALARGRTVEVPSYDFSTHRRRPETRRVAPADYVLVDGILLLAFPELRESFDGRVFVEASEMVRFARRLARDQRERGRTRASVEAQFAATVRPMHDCHVEPSRAFAHRIANGEGDLRQEAAELARWARALRSVPACENR
jgi:uridine kinase